MVHFRCKPSNQRRKPQINGHSKESRSFDVDLHCNTFKIRFWAVYTQAYDGAGAIAPEHAAAKRGHHPFFFLVREKGGFVRTLRTPLGYVPGRCAPNEPSWFKRHCLLGCDIGDFEVPVCRPYVHAERGTFTTTGEAADEE